MKLRKIFFLLIVFSLLAVLISCDDSATKDAALSIASAELPEPFEDPDTIIYVTNVDELMATQYSTKDGNVTVVIKSGTYQIPGRLWLTGDHVTYQSESGNRNDVIIKGAGAENNSVPFIFSVVGDYFALKNVTIGEVYYHALQIHGEKDTNYTYIKNVRFYNIRQQMIKGSYDKVNNPEKMAKNIIIEDCLFEYTSGVGYYFYCGGIDIHSGQNMIIRNNTFKNIISPDSSLAEGAIHLWTESRNALIEKNTIINCGRGILLGFDTTSFYDGVVRNNSVHAVRDTGIYACNTVNTEIYNNTVYIDSSYQSAVEYRKPGTSGLYIANNLCNKIIKSRDSAVATLESNIQNAEASWFENASAADLHLKSAVSDVVNKGTSLTISDDIDGDQRDSMPDIGADEYK